MVVFVVNFSIHDTISKTVIESDLMKTPSMVKIRHLTRHRSIHQSVRKLLGNRCFFNFAIVIHPIHCDWECATRQD
jgi:hypothetical protein